MQVLDYRVSAPVASQETQSAAGATLKTTAQTASPPFAGPRRTAMAMNAFTEN
jgi:hypothetical protein